MNCPQCGSPISKSAVMCPICQMPVALMSGTKGNPEVITPPLNSTPSSVEPFMHPVIRPSNENREPVAEMYKNYGEGKKAITSLKFVLPIFIGILLSIGVAFGVYSVVKMYIQDNKIEPILENKSYQVEWNDFTYTLDSIYTYSKPSPSLLEISTSENTWSVTLQIIPISYTSVQTKKNQLKSYFTSLGYTTGNVNESVYNGISFITLEATKGTKKTLLAVTKAGNSNLTFGLVLTKQKNTFGYDLLESLSMITTNAKYEKKETIKENLDFDFKEALK